MINLILWPLQLILTLLGIPVTPVLVAISLFWARHGTPEEQTSKDRPSKNGLGTMPPALSFLQTWDDVRPNQGMYESQVKRVFDKFGWFVKTWWWLGVRNQLNGLFHAMAPRIDWRGDTFRQWGTRPQTKGPYRPGAWFGLITGPGLFVLEFAAVWPYTAKKCGAFRIGWKCQPLFDLKASGKGTSDDRAEWCFQPKLLPITRDSTT